ncbi:hypothetical protein P2318_34120 [Myxococcaceae bacterium GXIMD 01537]
MLALALSLVLASSPSPAEDWARKACPEPAAAGDSPIEQKAREASRTECLKRAMNRSLDQVLLPLKKQKSPAFREWMGLQADYNRWMADACAAVEEARWVDLSTGKRAMGTGYGAAENQCLQQQYAWRGFFVDALARGDTKALDAALAPAAETAPQRREELETYQRLTREAATRAPAQVPEAEAASAERSLTQEDWRHYDARLVRAAAGPEALARRQCALVATSTLPGCEARLAGSLLAPLDFHDALPTAPPPVTPPVPTGSDGVR